MVMQRKFLMSQRNGTPNNKSDQKMYFNAPNYPAHLSRTDAKASHKKKEAKDRTKSRLLVMQKKKKRAC